MKKVKLSLVNKHIINAQESVTYDLFHSPEALYVWLQDHQSDDSISIIDIADVVTLNNQEYAEVEWLGCEYLHINSSKSIRFDNVQFIKFSPAKISKGKVINVYQGWILQSPKILQFKTITTEQIVMQLLTPDDEQFDYNAVNNSAFKI